MSIVIVAIPEQQDRVWKVSSEKIPHMTLLYLGDSVQNQQKIIDFVEHAANTMLKQFYMPVDTRGELGDDKADVLFFQKNRYDYKAVRDFRSALLKDANIQTAFQSADQFDGWTPHLTLGYPTDPAKELPEGQDHPFYDVSFDRIAVWTGDFEGPTFDLKNYWDDADIDAPDAAPSFAMSVFGTAFLNHYKPNGVEWEEFVKEQELEKMQILEHFADLETVEIVDNEEVPVDTVEHGEAVTAAVLEHHGVKGMKWGVRKEKVSSAVGAAKAGYSKAREVDTKVKKAIARAPANAAYELAARSPAMLGVYAVGHRKYAKQDRAAINAKYNLKDVRLIGGKKDVRAAYLKDHRQALVDRLKETAESLPSNVGGRRQITVKQVPGDPYTMMFTTRKTTQKERAARHDAMSETSVPDEFYIRLVTDKDGIVTDAEVVEPKTPVEHSIEDTVDRGADFLAHQLFSSTTA